MENYEQLGLFYLGREYDLAARKPKENLVLYDAKDLTTHAVCMGMTGSGKTGLCLALLEEAAIDGVPAIAIDPKGDLGNLLLTFPNLQPSDFRPWVDESEAGRKNITPDQLAEQTATRWREGLAEWGQDGERIKRLRAAADVAIYTPGSNAGLPLAVLRSFDAPPPEIASDDDLLRERVTAATSGLLTLVGIDADPIRSREHILICQLLDNAWRKGQHLDLAGLVRAIQSPPLERVGTIDLESFFPSKERTALAMQINNLLASPGFAGWMQGEPLDINRLLYTPEGKPRLSILSIAHLSDAERMFFVTLLLNEVLAWTRAQSGTTSLRAILYMDEIFGFFPPTANPPSKTPMLTLLKQARAFGLGIVLATQNPVDLDYKGLSNTGTWFLGRLQTERDKARVLEGLEGASAAAGNTFNRGELEAQLAALGNRVFLLNNVHEDHPVVFETRWCLSYLRGPLARGQIQELMKDRKAAGAAAPVTTTASSTMNVGSASSPSASTSGSIASSSAASGDPPLLPSEISQLYFKGTGKQTDADARLIFRPNLWGAARLHFVDAKANVDCWRDVSVLVGANGEVPDDPWTDSQVVQDNALVALSAPPAGATFLPLPAALARPKSYASWSKLLAGHLFRNQMLPMFVAPALGEYSKSCESEGDFRVRMTQKNREARDAALEKHRAKFAARVIAAENQIQRAMERVAREKSEFTTQATQTAVSFGQTVLRAIFGRKLASSANVTGAASTARNASRAARQREDVGRAEQQLETAQVKLHELEADIAAGHDQIAAEFENFVIEPYPIRPRKGDIAIEKVALAWVD